MCVQTLPLPTARRDSQCTSNDRERTREVVRPRGGVRTFKNKELFWALRHLFQYLVLPTVVVAVATVTNI